MHPKYLAIALCAFTTVQTFSAPPLQKTSYNGRTIPLYGKATNPQQQALLDSFKETHMMESLAQTVQDTIHLKHDLGIGVKSCGNPNAFFDHKRSIITLCLEMIELIIKQADADPQLNGENNISAKKIIISGAVFGIFLHELGHAILDINQVPITGREEDVADQFAIYYATKITEPLGKLIVVFPTVWFFHSIEKRQNLMSEEILKQVMADEHSLDAQRTFNLACWALGANKQTGTLVADFVQLPKKRAQRCEDEYIHLEYAMQKLLSDYLIIKPM